MVTELGHITKVEAERGRFINTKPAIVKELLSSRDSRLLLHGPVGCGKTRMALEKMRACCLKYDRCRWLLLSLVRKWLTKSALVTWEEKVVLKEELIPDRVQRGNRYQYRFRNGSIIDVAGLDDPQSVLSTEYDGAIVIEANNVPRDTIEILDGRLRYGRMPYQQLIMDCNPQSPRHWLYRAMHDQIKRKDGNAGTWLKGMAFRHTDNPALYNEDGTLTKFGQEYLARIYEFTGVRFERYVLGRWVQAEGVVYDRWDESLNVVPRFKPPTHWRRVWSIDFGYTNPFVWQDWAIDEDGRMYLVREIYRTKLLVEDAAAMIKQVASDVPSPEAIVCDHDREDRATLERHLGMRTIPAQKEILNGIDVVSSRMKPAGDGRPRLMIMDQTLVHSPDEELVEAKEPTGILGEMDEYVWAKSQDGLVTKDKPEDKRNHSMDAMRYAVKYVDGGSQPASEDSYSSPAPDQAIEAMFGATREPSWG